MLLEAYLAIQELVLASGAGIKHFDWFNQQYLDDNTEGYSTPAVFIEFVSIPTSSLANKIQKADLNFRLHLVTERTRHTHDGSSKQLLALDHLKKAELLYKGLEGKGYVKPASEQNPEERQIINSCSRTGIVTDHNFKELNVIIQEFRCVAFDYSAVTQKIKAQPRLVIT